MTYAFGGFRPAVNADGTSIFGSRVIPVKIKLFDALGAVVTDAQPRVWIVANAYGPGGEEVEAGTSVSSADTGNYMRYDASEQQCIYNLDVMDLPNGKYKIRVDLGEAPLATRIRKCRSRSPAKGRSRRQLRRSGDASDRGSKLR